MPLIDLEAEETLEELYAASDAGYDAAEALAVSADASETELREAITRARAILSVVVERVHRYA